MPMIPYLAVVNLICAAIGLGQNILVVKLLGPEQYGAVAIVVAFNAVAANFFDLRLSDVIAKLYFNTRSPAAESESVRYRASVIQVGLLGQMVLAGLLTLVGTTVAVMTIGNFTDANVGFEVILAASGAQSFWYIAALLAYVQRFSEKFGVLGFVQLANSTLGALLILLVVWWSPTVNGYTFGILLAAGSTLLVTAVSTNVLLRQATGIRLLGPIDWTVIRTYQRSVRFLFAANFLGYTKLLHRAADVLLVGFFCDDRMTGFYKLGRSMTDVLYTLFDAANKVYQPKFLRLLSIGNLSSYRLEAHRVLIASLAITMSLVVSELVFLPDALSLVFGPAFLESGPVIILLSLPFFFVSGVFLWIWPVLVFHGDVTRYTLYSAIAVILGQYLLGIALFILTGRKDMVWFAAGYAFSYVILYALTALHVRKRYREIVPALVPVGNA